MWYSHLSDLSGLDCRLCYGVKYRQVAGNVSIAGSVKIVNE